MAQKRKRAMKKAMGKAGGLLGEAGRGLMGRRGRLEAAIEGQSAPTRRKRKTTAKKKRKKRY